MVPLTRYRFSVDEFVRMAEVGLFDADKRVELIEGEVLVMAPMGPPHAWCVTKLNHALPARPAMRRSRRRGAAT